MAPAAAKKRGKAKATVDMSAIGSTGLKQYGGIVYEETHPKLKGVRGPRMYREMAENDAVVWSVLYVLRTWCAQATWRAEPADDSPEAKEWADFLDGARDDMSHTWGSFISELLNTQSVYGWAWFEVCYKRREGPGEDPKKRSKFDDGYIGWRKFSIRAPDTLDTWDFDEEGGIQGMWQMPPDGKRVYIPIAKSLLFRTIVQGNNPEGKSLLRGAFRSWWMLKRIQEIEAVGIERDLAGYPTMQIPLEHFDPAADSTTLANKAAMEKLVSEIRRDEREGAVIPSELDDNGQPTGYKLQLLSTGGQRAINVGEVIKRYESRIAMTLLAEFVLLGTDKVGSFSMHASKTDVFAVSLRTILQNIEEVLNRHAISRLLAMNGCPEELMPKLKVGEVAPPPLAEIAAFIGQLSSAGMLTRDDATERALREMAGLPEFVEGETQPGMLEEDGPENEDEEVDANGDGVPDQSQQTAQDEADASDGMGEDETREPAKQRQPLRVAKRDYVERCLDAAREQMGAAAVSLLKRAWAESKARHGRQPVAKAAPSARVMRLAKACLPPNAYALLSGVLAGGERGAA